MKKTNVFVVGHSIGYANWIPNHTIVKSMKSADVVLFTGGEDINPGIYGEPVGKYTSFNTSRDIKEMDAFDEAKKLNLPMLGICRGAQLLCALSGGRLIQHQHNPSYMHDITTVEGDIIPMSSMHHQAQYPYDMDKKSYKLIAWTDDISSVHLDGNDKEISKKSFKEAEIVFYPHTNCLSIQGHPEMMWRSKDKYKDTFNYLNTLVSNLLNKSFKL